MNVALASPLTLEFDDIEYELDEAGFLQHQSDWSSAVAVGMATREGIELEAAHWEVINYLRSYYLEYKIAPSIRVLTRALGKRLGPDKGNNRYLNQLFPFGPAKQACRYAGLPRPTGCI
jgi:TusE/DsrC/DsvC family sulfur relay protein